MEEKKIRIEKPNSLKKGINIIYDMELNRVMMVRLYNSLKNTIERMDFSSHIVRPVEPVFKQSTLDNPITGKSVAIAGFICAFIGMLTSCSASGNYENSIFGTIGKVEDSIGNGLLGGIIGFAIGAIIGYLIGYFTDKNELERVKSEDAIQYQLVWKKYEEKCKEYKKAIEAEKKELAFLGIKRDALIQQCETIREQYDRTTDMLMSFYDLLNIDSKFRNIHPLGYMCEFINLGISNKLEGADGLYYLVLKELRYDQMQYSLYEISSKLDKIINNQRAIYSELCQINYTADQMHRAILTLVTEAQNQTELQKQINEKSEINNYILQRISSEQEYQSQMIIISDLINN